jgi:hypothetical protein
MSHVHERPSRAARGAAPMTLPPISLILLALTLLALILLLVGAPAMARASDGGAIWQFAPAEAPPPPSGAAPSPFPTALGKVGDISFWSPNRGVLITAGNALVEPGLYAYDGVSWHQLSTKCGATDGRIAWAGENEFWTVSDQRPGQDLGGGGGYRELWDVSLCHFVDGQIAASYALPLGQPDSYQPMDAAVCDGPDNCWFGGELGEPGAFHLHWNGSSLSVVYNPQGGGVAAIAVDGAQIFESVGIGSGGGESTTNPVVLHTIVASDPSDYFHDVFPTEASCTSYCPTLPDYGTDGSGQAIAPATLAGFALSSDWSPSGDGPPSPQLWAVAGPNPRADAHPIVLRYSDEEWTQVVPNLATFEPGEDPLDVAADPGEQAAWVTLAGGEGGVADVDLLASADGGATWSISERDALGPEQGVGPRGEAGPIACPAAHECWLATTEGWLFHLTVPGTQLAKDTDLFFDGEDGVITYRPPDAGVQETIPFQAPESESLASLLAPEAATSTTAAGEQPVQITPAKPALVQHAHTHLLRGDVLELTFALAGAAHVQLLASRHGKVVARTRRESLRKGSHTLKLKLNPRCWPTKLDLKASAIG